MKLTPGAISNQKQLSFPDFSGRSQLRDLQRCPGSWRRAAATATRSTWRAEGRLPTAVAFEGRPRTQQRCRTMAASPVYSITRYDLQLLLKWFVIRVLLSFNYPTVFSHWPIGVQIGRHMHTLPSILSQKELVNCTGCQFSPSFYVSLYFGLWATVNQKSCDGGGVLWAMADSRPGVRISKYKKFLTSTELWSGQWGERVLIRSWDPPPPPQKKIQWWRPNRKLVYNEKFWGDIFEKFG